MTIKISHESSKVVDATIKWLRKEYEVIFHDGSGAMKVCCRKIHVYVGMTIDFSTKGEVHITTLKHLDDAVETFENAQANFSKIYQSQEKEEQVAADCGSEGLVRCE